MAATSFANRITDLIGSEYTTIASNSAKDLFNVAVAHVVDMLPTGLLLKYAVDPQDITDANGWNAVEGKKVLMVTRIDANSSGFERRCLPIEAPDFSRAGDINSIYYATAYSPIYGYPTDGGTTVLKVLPVPNALGQKAMVYYFTYPSDATDYTANTSIDGVPNEVEQAIVLKACVNILQTYISDFVQDEEDSEILNMLNNQVGTLQQGFAEEMSRFSEPQRIPKGE